MYPRLFSAEGKTPYPRLFTTEGSFPYPRFFIADTLKSQIGSGPLKYRSNGPPPYSVLDNPYLTTGCQGTGPL